MKKLLILLLVFTVSAISSQAQVYTPAATIQGTSNSNFLGIGTNNPVASIEINAPFIEGLETVLKVRVSDADQDYFSVINCTGATGQFIPCLYGYHISDNRPALYLIGDIESFNDSGIEPVTVFDSRLTNSTVITRPLFSWETYGNRKMTLNANGSLGVGTTITGPHKLAVEGSIGAREIKVQFNGWSDFVFDKNYELPTLEEVEKYIKMNGHLSEIPSEKEVIENGINLGEMNKKLLQKIEELTLYMIEQNQKIKQQVIEISENKADIEKILCNVQKG